MTETRILIVDAIRSRPGIHFNELVRCLDLATGQVQYHLKELCDGKVVVAEHLYGQTHYYPPTYDNWERRALALLCRETAGDIVAYLLAHGPTHPGTVAGDLGIARSTLEWQLDRLVAHDLVVKDRNGGRVMLAVGSPDRTVELLQEANPALRDRIVDRFTRLVDQLLSER